MVWFVIILAAGVMLILALFMTSILGWANEALHVEVDPKIEAINAALPGANCGGCGYVGCGDYAEALVVEKDVPVTLCPVGGEDVAAEIAKILGVEIEQSYPYRPVVHCGATCDDKLGQHPYHGEHSCTAANLVAGVQGCVYGCLGMGDCIASCKFGAIKIEDCKVVVDYDKCVGCGACEKACPRHVISMVPFKSEQMFVIRCNNKDFGKDVKAVCKVGCIGCGVCARNAEGLISMEGKLPKFNYESYDPATIAQCLKTAVEKCPMGGIVEVGHPTKKDLDAVKDETLPDVVVGTFETTVDKTEWRG